MNTSDRPVGLPVWEMNMYDELTGHVASEASLLDRYSDLATSARGHVKFLLELIGEDEARHHRLFEQLAETIRQAGLLQPARDGVPDLVREEDPAGLVEAVDELLAIEKADADHLKQMQRELKDFRATTIWPLVVELMQLDTNKHIKILQFLRQHASESARRSGDASR